PWLEHSTAGATTMRCYASACPTCTWCRIATTRAPSTYACASAGASRSLPPSRSLAPRPPSSSTAWSSRGARAEGSHRGEHCLDHLVLFGRGHGVVERQDDRGAIGLVGGRQGHAQARRPVRRLAMGGHHAAAGGDPLLEQSLHERIARD